MFSTLALVLICNVGLGTCVHRPVIGILAQEFSKGIKYAPATSYIAASYVKAVEAAGARVVPIFIEKPYSYYENILHSINGVVFPGGEAKLSPGNGYYDALTNIYDIAKKMYDKKIFFPVFGVCLGFEGILKRANDHKDILTKCYVIHENYPLIFTSQYNRSLLFSDLSEENHIYLKYFPVTHNNHIWCITPSNFYKSFLKRNWLITSVNINKRGLKFISAVEHKKYPFLAVQFHPEKQYEWNPYLNTHHSKIVIKANRHFYDVFVDLSKLNNNKFKNVTEERNSLIYNYSPLNTYKFGSFDQIYVFT